MINMSLKTLYIYSIPLVLVVIIFGKFVLKKRLDYLFFFSIFLLYVLSVLKLTLLPIPLPSLVADLRTATDAVLFINYKPLWLSDHFRFLLKEQILNIFLFVPFGFLINYLINLRPRKVILHGLIATLAIEILQVIMCLLVRFPYRVIDVNDLIYNFAGCCIGLVIFKCYSFILVRYVERFKVNLGPISQYMYNIAKRSRVSKRQNFLEAK